MKQFITFFPEGDCPATWEVFLSQTEGEKCYHFQQNVGTYSEVRAHCQTKGGDIVIINSADENSFIFDRIQLFVTTAEWGYDSVWIGADSLETGTEYKFVNYRGTGYDTNHRWDTTTLQNEGYWNWWPAEPAHVGAQNCAIMQKTYSAFWNDEECESNLYKRGAVCELGDGVNSLSTPGHTGNPTTESITSLKTLTTSKVTSTEDISTEITEPFSSPFSTSLSTNEATVKSTKETTPHSTRPITHEPIDVLTTLSTSTEDESTKKTSTFTNSISTQTSKEETTVKSTEETTAHSMRVTTDESTKGLTSPVTSTPSSESSCQMRTGTYQPSSWFYFIKKDEVCILNNELSTMNTTNPTRCARQCMRQQACVSFSFIVGSEENLCILYKVTKDFNGVSLTEELLPGLPCQYYELDQKCEMYG
ncbi:Collectin-10 [Holothuria leucospilota]|uniref:Collectin-10 n=1 Tax=Holothuria leucospilota TaxID=206669 RepID=A0A9Q1GYX9_HOLLE|nr:Collectin-10 [Holothuria leucospilota]